MTAWQLAHWAPKIRQGCPTLTKSTKPQLITMGYYVSIEESTFMIPVENLDAAYEAMCKLNHTVPNDKKRGGSWPDKDNAPEYGPDPSVWFSWMEWNYDEICTNADEILQNLVFILTPMKMEIFILMDMIPRLARKVCF